MALEESLAEQLSRLYALQEADERIRHLEEQRQTLNRRRHHLETLLQKAQSEFEAKRHAYTALHVEQRRKNTELQALQERLKKYAEQQKNARDANEYLALGRQIETSTRQLDALENGIIEVLLKLDEAEAALDAEKKRLTAAQTEIEQEKKRVAVVAKRIDVEMEKALQMRQAAVAHLSPSLLREYETWRQRSRGQTMIARLVKETCEGCQMTIPPQMAIEVRKMTRRFTCPSCHRLLLPLGETTPPEEILSSETASPP